MLFLMENFTRKKNIHLNKLETNNFDIDDLKQI